MDNQLKMLVNNPIMWKVLDNHLEECYNNRHKEMEKLSLVEDIYRAQGYIQAINALRDLKVKVNAK